jgi:uncharacterized protein YbaP (TraB family)
VLNNIQFYLFVLLFAIANPVFAGANNSCPPVAEVPTPEKIQAAKHAARDHGFLWRISKNGHTSFLYGTIHVAKFEWTFPGKQVMQALRASDTLALELDMLDSDIQKRISKGMEEFHSVALPESMVNRVRKQAEAVCVQYGEIANLAPELQVDTLTLMVGNWDGLYASYAIDSVLAGIGHNTNKQVVSLETPESQLKLIQMKDAQETIALVQDSLDDMESGRAHTFLSHVAEIWENANYTEMSKFNEWCDCLKTDVEREMMKRLLDDRNPALAVHIDALHESGKKVFVAVGSLHMFGQNGLPFLLERRGYHIDQIELNSK